MWVSKGYQSGSLVYGDNLDWLDVTFTFYAHLKFSFSTELDFPCHRIRIAAEIKLTKNFGTFTILCSRCTLYSVCMQNVLSSKARICTHLQNTMNNV